MGGPVREQFTPGPWHVVRYGDGDSLVIHHSDEERVCFMATPGSSPAMKRIQANASLITAAPELYEALAALIEATERHVFGNECLIERIAAHAALAKARGEQP
jgi:hypothetical protein